MIKEHSRVFGQYSEIIHCRKGELLLAEGRIENFIYFVIRGSFVQLLNRHGNEVCKSFSLEHSFFSSYTSFLSRKPSGFTIVALEDSLVERIHYDHIQEAYRSSLQHQENGRLIAEKLFMEESQRVLSLISQCAEERYLELLEKDPSVLQRIPLKYLASYLGITPVSLSRLRNKISRK